MASADMPTPPSTPIPSNRNIWPGSASRPIHMMLDFDGTITTTDTTSHIANFACNLPPDPHRRELRRSLWAFCLSEYATALSSKPHNRTSMQGEGKGLAHEIQCHRSLRGIEEESISRCGEAGIFYGASTEALSQAGWKLCQSSKVKIRDGFSEMIGRIETCAGGKSRWGIVSVSWSRDFLRGVIGFALGSKTRALNMPVLSNEIKPDSGLIIGPSFGPAPHMDRNKEQQPVSNSHIKVSSWTFRQLQTLLERKRIVSSDDKLAAMRSMRDSFEGSVNGRSLHKCGGSLDKSSDLNPLVVYVGDSLTDLECLLEAEVGIAMAVDGKSALMEMLRREKYFVRHISAWTPHKEKTIWHAQNFRDITYSGLFHQPSSAVPKLRHGSV